MPKVTVYIRNEDLDAWKSVEQKTEFIHNALNRDDKSGRLLTPSEWDELTGKPIKTPEIQLTVKKGVFHKVIGDVEVKVNDKGDKTYKPIKTPEQIKRVLAPAISEKPCKHGFPPAFCRFARPGKPCK